MGSRDLDTCTIFVQSLRWLKSQKVYDLGHVDNFGKKSLQIVYVFGLRGDGDGKKDLKP